MDPGTESRSSPEAAAPLNQEKRVDALVELWKGTSARITERRSYEWKLAYGIWGVQLIALWQLLSHESSFTREFLYVLAGLYLAMGLFLTVAHRIYVFKAIRTYDKIDSDRRRTIELALTDAAEAGLAPRDYAVKSPVHWLEVILTGSLAAVGTAALVAVALSR